tara:strand:- start:19364 stop:19849 length:486 start_codon:yes stop_codon:yes gene_type:complete
MNFKEKIIEIYKENKLKTFFLIGLFLSLIISLMYLNIHDQKKNKIIAEKYIEAGIYLASNKKEKSRIIYEEIILSKNEFYSILALNTILENKLISDEKKLLEFFEIVEKANSSNYQKDLLTFKKGLFLLKISKIKEGNDLLNSLVKSESKFKQLAEEVLTK